MTPKEISILSARRERALERIAFAEKELTKDLPAELRARLKANIECDWGRVRKFTQQLQEEWQGRFFSSIICDEAMEICAQEFPRPPRVPFVAESRIDMGQVGVVYLNTGRARLLTKEDQDVL